MADVFQRGFSWIIPSLIFTIFFYGHIRGVEVFDTFVEGATEGFLMAVKLIPYLVGIYMAVGIFRESGAINLFVQVLAPVLKIAKAPADALLLSVVRTLSGPAAMGMMLEIFDAHGPDSFIGRLASTLIGSTDTTFYIIAVYFGSVGIKKPRHSVIAGVLADMAGFLASVYIVRRLFL